MREKLIELLESAESAIYWSSSDKGFIEKIADHLIANGVTVQKWIPVSERLPDDDSDVLAFLRIGEESRIYPACYAKGVWWDCIFNTPATKTTTHWMPLPEAPGDTE